tara:strand:+ start:47537 stop:47914 length:378 start_codon:yes stop_codon:yes gene_type:complete
MFALLTGLLLAGCAGLFTEKPAEEQVRERAQAWADALLEDDLEKAYSYTSPNYRSFAGPGAYHARVVGAGSWRSAEVSDIQCSDEVCDVTFMLEYYARQVKVEVRRPRTYKWVKTDGQWWLYVAP